MPCFFLHRDYFAVSLFSSLQHRAQKIPQNLFLTSLEMPCLLSHTWSTSSQKQDWNQIEKKDKVIAMPIEASSTFLQKLFVTSLEMPWFFGTVTLFIKCFPYTICVVTVFSYGAQGSKDPSEPLSSLLSKWHLFWHRFALHPRQSCTGTKLRL
jgi:hypothetical protein